jgi:GAF domain-containing protein
MRASHDDHPAHVVEQLEALLRQLRWCRSAGEAETLVAERLAEMTHAERALLYVVGPCGVHCESEGGAALRALAAATVVAGHARADLIDGRAALAVPLTTVSVPVGVLVLLHEEDEALHERELALLRLFAEHAGPAIRRLSMPVSAL